MSFLYFECIAKGYGVYKAGRACYNATELNIAIKG